VVMPHFSKTRIDSSSRSVSFSTGFDSGLSANDEILQNYGNHSLSFESKRRRNACTCICSKFCYQSIRLVERFFIHGAINSDFDDPGSSTGFH
jgi:hypothetical protein